MNELFGIPLGTLLVDPRSSRSAPRSGRSRCSALRNRILVKLAVRSVGRRPGRSALIVVGLMLGTTIIAAALTTGDTMSHTIRSTASRRSARPTRRSRQGAVDDIPGELGAATGTGWIGRSVVVEVERQLEARISWTASPVRS